MTSKGHAHQNEPAAATFKDRSETEHKINAPAQNTDHKHRSAITLRMFSSLLGRFSRLSTTAT
jgi:hypothetical protein